MNSAIRTYGKREFRKISLLPVFSLVYTLLVYGTLSYVMNGLITEHYLKHGFSDMASYIMLGDCFFYYLYEVIMSAYHVIFVLGFEIFLVQRLFYLENREGVSDFLRVLPVREKDKVLVKVVIGESMNAFFALIFGVVGTITYKMFERDLVFQNQVFGSTTSTNAFLLIWQVSLLMFVTMSAIFLVLYLAQSVIHHRAVAFGVGAGVLFVPAVFAAMVIEVLDGSYQWIYAAISPLKPYAQGEMVTLLDGEDFTANRFLVEWNCYSESVILWSAIAVLAGVLIAVSVKCRWNLRESSNRMINSSGVHSFLISGIAFCAAMSVTVMADLFINTVNYECFSVYLRDVLCIWILLYVIAMGVLWLIRKWTRKNG